MHLLQWWIILFRLKFHPIMHNLKLSDHVADVNSRVWLFEGYIMLYTCTYILWMNQSPIDADKTNYPIH